jgi:hypothetical protein
MIGTGLVCKKGGGSTRRREVPIEDFAGEIWFLHAVVAPLAMA